MNVPLLQIDAFTDRAFAGNPAAVCLLEAPAAAAWMALVAREMNLSETAFVVPREGEAASGGEAELDLRWFTPAVEVDLCGHATLASAYALWHEGRVAAGRTIRFWTRSGPLLARQRGGLVELDFPAQPASRKAPPDGLVEALGVMPSYVGSNGVDYLVEVPDEETVRGCEPDFRLLAGVEARGVMVTSRSASGEYHFVSRFFGPAAGIDEDPVTGSAHCCLGPHWGERLGLDELVGYQASARGGTVRVRLEGERVVLAGAAVLVLRGELVAPATRDL